MRRFGGALIVLVVLGLWLPGSPAHGVTDQEVLIGLNVPQTGPYALQGKDQINAYALAKLHIEEQGGILGRSIRYLVADSQSHPDVSVKNVRGFIDEGVDMVTGGSSSAVAIAVSQLCQAQSRLFMATLTYSNDLTTKDAHRYTFRETYNAWMASKALSKHLTTRFPHKKYFYITSDYSWGWTTRDSMKQLTGTQGASDVPMPFGEPLGSPRYKAAIQKAVDERAEVLVLVLFGRDMMAALQECMSLGVKHSMQIVVPNLEMHMVLGSSDESTESILGAVPWYWQIPYQYNFEGGKRFVELYRARYGKPPCSGAATAYTNIMLYKWAVEQSKSFDPRAVIRALEGHTFQMLKDEETIRSWDHQTIQSVYVVRGKGAGKKDIWDVFEVLEAHAGEDLAQTREESPVRLEPLYN
jgi:ABC-type branched-subunit amino acid transport system substrate-binding protein